MAVGKKFKSGQLMDRAGVYVRWSNDGESPTTGTTPKVALAIVDTDWGGVGDVTTVHGRDVENLKHIIGEGKGADVVKSLFRGGASTVKVIRVGNGGEKGNATIGNNGIVNITTKYPTDREIEVEIKESVMGDEKDFYVIEGDRVLEKYRIVAGDDEASDLVEVLKDSSNYIDAEVEEEGTLPDANVSPLEGGSNPTVTGEDYTDAMAVAETDTWDVIVVDTKEIAVLNATAAFVGRRIDEGARCWAVLPADDDTPIEKRIEMTGMYNKFYVYLVGMTVGNLTIEETTAQVAGETIRGDYKRNITRKPMEGMVEIKERLTSEQYDMAARKGLITFSYNRNGQVVIEYGINTLQNDDEETDMGWRSLRRMRTRYELIDRIGYEVEAMLERGHDTDDDSLQHIITKGNTIIADMIHEGGLKSGKMILDPAYPPEGDSAWFTFENLVDLDGLNKVYIHFPLAYKR